MEEAQAVRALGALAHHNRLQIFRELVVAGPAGLTPGALIETLGIAAATLSFHLKELVVSGLVTQEREGRNLIYRAAFNQMQDLVDFLTANCCEASMCVPAQSTGKR